MTSNRSATADGGYDVGYRSVPCFWGTGPGSLVAEFAAKHSVIGWRVLDAGAGEGKNSAYLAQRGAEVTAVELSSAAIKNARRATATNGVTWIRADIRWCPLPTASFDLVILYGLLHCLRSRDEIQSVVGSLMKATRPGGHHLACSFNARHHDLSAHPGFEPCLLDHAELLDLYSTWNISSASDTDLHEVHPHNLIPHTHSMTRVVARKPHAAREC